MFKVAKKSLVQSSQPRKTAKPHTQFSSKNTSKIKFVSNDFRLVTVKEFIQ